VTGPSAWLFPGQGVDLGSAHAFMQTSPAVRAYVESASAITGENLASLLRSGAPRLFESRLLQPALTALSLGIADELLRAGARPGACAGHSLGELAALAAAGALRSEAALRLAATRGELMGSAARKKPGGMLALTESDRASVDAALALGAKAGALTLAARNAPDEWVLSGDAPALALVAGRFRSVRLRVEGAWHSLAMLPALEDYRAALAATELQPPHAAFVSGERGDVAWTPADLRADLAAQLTRPLDFTRVLERLRSIGTECVVCVGPGKTLRSFVRRCLGASLRVLSTDSPRDLETTAKELSR
jgi:[acyl-carrier-protein] S-malonyltransferase